MKFVLVHGFNVRDGGAHTVDVIEPCILASGHDVDRDEGDYGYFNLFMVSLIKSKQRQRVLYRLAEAFKSADVIWTHSNGQNFSNQALDMLPPEYNNTKVLIATSPAANCKTPIPQAVKAQLVMHTPNDWAVRLSSYIPFSRWGRQGARGYEGDDNRNTNYEDKGIPEHSAWWVPKHRNQTFDVGYKFALEHK